MDSQEQLTLDVVVKVSSGQIPRKQGQKVLNVSERTLRRYLADYLARGALFVKHGNAGRVASNRTPLELKDRVMSLVMEKYFDFNLTHLQEKLLKDEQIDVGYDTLRRWCHKAHHVKHARPRKARVRRRRDRMEQAGLMLQMDGSPHCWFDGRPSCLIAAIDDATGDVPYGEFFLSEDTISCMRVLQKIIEKKGLFQILYVDKAGIFGGPKRAHFSQVRRALAELGVQIIFANSPEAKGRIERLWGTLQDRLIPEMRLRKIRSFESANEYLQTQFLLHDYAQNFLVTPANLAPAYRELPVGVDLKEIFCIKERRTCKRDHTFRWQGDLYQVDSPLKNSIYKQSIELRTYQDGSWKAFFAAKTIEVRKVDPVRKRKSETSGKIIQLHGTQVRVDGHVEYQGRYYSVDEKYCRSKVSIIEKDGRVLILQDGIVIESHSKLTSFGSLCSTKPEHLAPWKRELLPDSPCRKAARRYGKHTDEFVLRVLQTGNGFIDTNAIWGVLGMDRSYSPTAIDQACKYALEIESPTYKAVKIFLKLQGNRWEQKTVTRKTV
jgi:hypothetical protein